MTRKILVLSVFVLLSCVLLTSCARTNKGFQIKGSDTMVNLCQVWAEDFMNKNPEMGMAVTGGGSGVGIASLLNGTTDIAISSRSMEEKEIKLAEGKRVFPYEIAVANDGIAVVVSPENKINKLTIKQISDIFSGKITTWDQVGGPKEKIVALSRDRNSGTHIFFLNHVVKLGNKKNPNEFAKATLMMPSNQAIVEEVSSNTSAVGYIGLGYLEPRLKAIAVAKQGSSLYVLPNVNNVLNNSYPISRPMYMYTNGKPKENIKLFIDFVLSKEGQQVVEAMGFVPMYK